MAAPRLSWLGCWGVCVRVCPLRLYPATPGWGVRCGCACLCLGFGCAPPLLAGVLWCVCACVRNPLVPRHPRLGCAVWVCVLGLGSRLRPATPGWGVGLCVCALRLYPATPGWGVRRGCVCLGSGFGCAPPLLAGVLGCACVCLRAPLVPRHSWLGCAMWVCVLELGLRLRPATPGWDVGVCVCLCAHSACTPPLLAGVCCVGVCVWARVSAAPRLSWLGCWGVRVCVRAPLLPRHSWLGCAVWVCVRCLGFRLRPASPGWGVWVCVCLCARSACTPPLLAGVCGPGVCAWARVSAALRHSWLGWWVCVCLCVRCACTLPLLAGVCGVGVCAWAWNSAAPRHSWRGYSGVCVLACVLRLYPATPGWGVGVCVCLCARSTREPPLLAGVCGVGVCAWALVSAAPRHSWPGCWGVCLLLCALRLYLAPPGRGVRCGCVCLGSGFDCAPPLLAGVLGCVCARLRAPLVPRHSWLGCWGVCVFVSVLRLYPATPGWGVRRGCVRLGSGLGCAPPLLVLWLRTAAAQQRANRKSQSQSR